MNGLGSDIFYRADVAYLGGDAVYCVYCPPALVTAAVVVPRSDEQLVITSGLDGLLRIWDCETAMERTQIITEHDRGVNCVAVASTGGATKALCCGDDGLALVYDLQASVPGGPPLRRLAGGHMAGAYCCAWTSTSGKGLLTGGLDRRTVLWDLRGRRPASVLPARQHVYALAPLYGSNPSTSSDAQAVAVGMSDGAIAHWDLRRASREPVRELRGHGGAVEALAVLPGDVLASASSDGILRLWDEARGGRPSWIWQAAGPLTSVTAVLEDTLLVSGVETPPCLLALDYERALPHVSDVLERCQLPSLQPWTRGRPGEGAPPEGFGRNVGLLQTRRLRRGSSRGADSYADHFQQECLPRGSFDRSTKTKGVPLGSTGAAHRAFLCRLRG
eukprot:TRINITY_DN17997_c0_g2_i1.p1 TRINITY_DN17997_c0_g2~~TRINITY_DN17997_c0_g2_i1.p1  ORF type:complete len:397 (-),score=34.92 TRINITY_DN17997_c0_g2_i1:29-1195(-)